MLKSKFIVVILVSIFFTKANASDDVYFNHIAKKMVGDYTSVVLVQLNGSSNYIKKNKYHLFKGGKNPTLDTYGSIKSKVAKISNQKSDVNAIASVHLLENKINKECVIVYKKGISANVIKHEAGHCFTPVRYQFPKFSKSNGSQNYNNYLNELFADLVASTISYKLEGTFTYIDQRSLNIKNKGPNAVDYKLAARSFDGLKSVLVNSKMSDSSHEASIKKMLVAMSEKFPPYTKEEYFENVKKYNKDLQRASR